MMNLTERLIPITPGSSVDIPNAHRPLRAMVAVDSGALSAVGFHSNERHEVQRELQSAINSNASVVIVTGGKGLDRNHWTPRVASTSSWTLGTFMIPTGTLLCRYIMVGCLGSLNG